MVSSIPQEFKRPPYDMDPSLMLETTKQAIQKAKQRLDELAKQSQVTFETGALEFERIITELYEIVRPLSFMKYVSPSKERREVANEIEMLIAKFDNELYSRVDLYNVLKQLRPLLDSLEGEDRELLRKQLRDFERRGASLPDDKRQEFLNIMNELSEAEITYQKNLNDVNVKIPFTLDDLKGVPQNIIESLERDGDKYLATLDYPVLYPILDFAEKEETRKRILHESMCKGGKENVQLLEKALDLRRKVASLLNYPTYADYVLEERMAKHSQAVFDFLESLRDKLNEQNKKELMNLKELKAKDLGKPVENIDFHLWDWRYYDKKMLREKYQVDPNEVKKYFPLTQVISGMLEVYQQVLDLRFEEASEAQVWHEDVKQYFVYDKRTGKYYGSFYLDLFPREGKFKHAAAFDIYSAYQFPNENENRPVASMVANFPRPTPSNPSLMPHEQVETLFHEFGHIMHQITTEAKYARFSGANVQWDFVEAPSQMLENWVWNQEVINLLSGHYENPSQKLPQSLLQKMLSAKLLNIAIKTLRQVFFAYVDMKYHTEPITNPNEYWLQLYPQITGLELPNDIIPSAGFGHIMGGYSAGYYGYLWSKVYAQDMFTRFEKEGILNSQTGYEYRKTILAKGGGYDGLSLVKSFLKREPSMDAFLKSLGIA